MARLGMFETPISTLTPIRCKRCGYGGLYWHQAAGAYRLHHWTVPEEGGQARFVLHRCGFDSWGRPKPPTSPEVERAPGGEGRDG